MGDPFRIRSDLIVVASVDLNVALLVNGGFDVDVLFTALVVVTFGFTKKFITL